MTRYHALDSVRAAMMLLGIVLHAAASYTSIPLGAAWPFRDAATSPLLNALVFSIHAFRMPVFFAMAGFFGALLYARRGAAGLLANRVRRVLVPLVVAWIVLLPFARAGFAFALRGGIARAGSGATQRGAAWWVGGNLIHLWFLYDLLFLYLAAVLFVSLWARLVAPRAGALGRAYRAIGASALGPAAWAAPTTLTLLLMPRGVLVTATGLVPDLRALLAYGVFFAFGWALYAHADLLAAWSRRAWPFVVTATLLLVPYLILIRGGARWSPRHLAAAGGGALIAWAMTFGLIGLAVRYLDRPIRPVRYLSDASYWMYLVHLPLVVWAAALLRGVAVPPLAKTAIVLVAVVPVLLVSYRHGVRSTTIGVWLNGRRRPGGMES